MNEEQIQYEQPESYGFLFMYKNLFLTIITLGLYSPWATVNIAKYFLEKTKYKNEYFRLKATGLGLFQALIIPIGLYISIRIAMGVVPKFFPSGIGAFFILGLIFLNVVVLTVINFYFLKYIVGNISIADREFVFDKQDERLSTLIEINLKGLPFTFITLGLYYPVLFFNLIKAYIESTEYNGTRFEFTGNKKTFYWIFVKNFFLVLITLGLYYPWALCAFYQYQINNVKVGNKSFVFDLSGVDFFLYSLKSFVLLVITLGLIFPYVTADGYKLFTNSLRTRES